MPTARSAAFIAALSLCLLPACESDDDESSDGGAPSAEPTKVSVSITGKGPTAKVEISDSVKAGLVELTFENDDEMPHDAQLVRVEGDHTLEEVEKVVMSEEGAPTPDWIEDGGGIGIVAPGKTGKATEVLEPGRHFVFDTDGGGSAEFEVTGEAVEAELPATDASITTVDYGFETSGLKAGKNTLTFANEGDELHHMLAAPISNGATFAQVKRFVSSERESSGPPPIAFEKISGTAVIDGGRSQVTELELEQGRYVLLCFISDRAGGPPHTAKGMIEEVEIPG